jgi:hypothetical protein
MMRTGIDDLVGRWESDPTDHVGIREMGLASVEFRPDATLHYTIHDGDRDQTSVLTYRVENGWLVTDQPSLPRVERTRFEILPDGRLVLDYGSFRSRYVRAT